MFQSFLVRLGENFFELVYFFLDGKDNNNNKKLITVHPPQQLSQIEINSSETCINNAQVLLNGHLSYIR